MTHYSSIRDLHTTFLTLLDHNDREQVYQEFLEQNPRLIPREFVQNHGIHLTLVVRKLSLAKDYTTDFFYLAKSSGDWNCVLIEIEKPQSKYFVSGTSNLHSDFISAIEQINRWRAWFANASNLDGFINGTIKAMRVPMALTSNPCHIRYVLVMGRRSEFEDNEHRRNVIYGHERADFHILSYDSLLEDLHSKRELYVAIRKNEYIEILSDRFAGESLFSQMPPEQLRISDQLRKDIMGNRDKWCQYDSDLKTFMLDKRLPEVPKLSPE